MRINKFILNKLFQESSNFEKKLLNFIINTFNDKISNYCLFLNISSPSIVKQNFSKFILKEHEKISILSKIIRIDILRCSGLNKKFLLKAGNIPAAHAKVRENEGEKAQKVRFKGIYAVIYFSSNLFT